MNSKRKGNAGELELLNILTEHGGNARRNDQRYVGGVDNPDIALEFGGKRYHVECKRAERFNAYAAMDQAQRDANGHSVPVVMHRRNRAPWLVVMRLSDWLEVVRRAE